MSVSTARKNRMARSLDAISCLIQYSVMIAGLLFVLGIVNFAFSKSDWTSRQGGALAQLVSSGSSLSQPDTVEPEQETPASLQPQFAGVLDYVKRRYRVSPEVVLPVLEAAQEFGKERRIDPLLIMAVIAIESGFNPFAESSMGARGLMQVMPRYHMDKVPEGMESHQLFDPAINIKVGVLVLEEAIQRRGGLTAGLQYYAGSSDPAAGYANKVLAEKARMEQAARRNTLSSA